MANCLLQLDYLQNSLVGKDEHNIIFKKRMKGPKSYLQSNLLVLLNYFSENTSTVGSC